MEMQVTCKTNYLKSTKRAKVTTIFITNDAGVLTTIANMGYPFKTGIGVYH